MKGKIITFLLYACNGLTIQYLISFGRGEKANFISLPLICLVFFFAGIVVRHYEKRINLKVIAFLLIALGLPLIPAFQIKGHVIYWILEFSVAVLSFLIGFVLEKYKISNKIILLSSLILFTIIVAFYINPRIVYKNMISKNSNKTIYGKQLSYRYIDNTGRVYTNDSLKDKVVLIEYYFAECSPCVLKMRDLKKLAEHYKDNKDFVILTVDAGDIDTYENFQKQSSVLPTLMQHVYDSGGIHARQLKIKGYPTEFLVDKKGIIREDLVGYGKDVSLIYLNKTINKIDALLKEK